MSSQLSASVSSSGLQRTKNGPRVGQPGQQGVYWAATIPLPCAGFPLSSLPDGVVWCRGQHERSDAGYEHVQAVFAWSKKVRLGTTRRLFPGHWEPTRSAAINDYVWKEDTRIAGTQFEFGAKPIRINSKVDWESVWDAAIRGDLSKIPPRIRVVSYRTLRAIAADNQRPRPMERKVKVFWGKTGTGKSRLAWEEAGDNAYAKCPRSKFWEGYQDQEEIIIDEFRGGIDVAHLLRWFDRYPVVVEIKGSSRPFNGKRIWITSNVAPIDWYRRDGNELDQDTLDALLRRLEIFEMNDVYVAPE